MNSSFYKYVEEGLTLEFDIFNDERKTLKNSHDPEFEELWKVCENMEKKAMQSFSYAIDQKVEAFGESAKWAYILRDGNHRCMKNFKLNNISFFVTSMPMFAHYPANNLCYCTKIFVDEKYVMLNFDFQKQ